jgi:hypothetical protein
MNPHDLETMKRITGRIDAEIETFYKACVPIEVRKEFRRIAEKHEPELFNEIQELRQTPMTDVHHFSLQKNILLNKSKELVRKISFVLHLKIEAKKNPS